MENNNLEKLWSPYSPGPLSPEIQDPFLKLYGERLKIYPQVKFIGITSDAKFTFQKHF